MQVIEMIADERRVLADVLVTLTPEQLAAPSLCGAWTVHDIAAHLLMPLVTGLPTVMLAMVTSAGNFVKANRALTARIAAWSIENIAQGLRDKAENPFSPTGMGVEAPLTDLLVHGQDLRRPLGLRREIPPDRAQLSLSFLAGMPRGFVSRPARRTGPVRYRSAVLLRLGRRRLRAGRGPAAGDDGSACCPGRADRRRSGGAACADRPPGT